MPLYEYECKPNRHRFEVRHGMDEDPVTACPECGAQVRRVINAVGIVFKGSGFYATDSRKASQAMSDRKESSESAAATKTDGGEKSESKPESGEKPAAKADGGEKKPDSGGGESKAAS